MRAGRVAALAVLGLTLTGGAPTQAAAPRASKHVVERETEAMNLNLRLVDLPPGYEVTSDFVVGSDGSCYRSLDHTRGTPDPFVFPHVECKLTFGDSWRPPAVSRPRRIGSASLRFEDVAGAVVAFDARRDLAYNLFDDAGDEQSSERVPATPLGDEATLWSWDTGAIVAWRTGHTVSFIQATLDSRLTPTSRRLQQMLERAVLRLAARQQARVMNPTPLLPSENDDSEVALGSPRLEVDVHWLGRHLEPGGGLPPLELFDSTWSYSWDEGPGWSVSILYVANGGFVSLSLWTPQAWNRYRRGIIGKRIFGSSCTKPRLVKSRGRAIVRSTKDSRRAPCNRKSGNQFFATVHFKNLVATVNTPICTGCISGSDYRVYNSEAGMRAVVRGLRARW